MMDGATAIVGLTEVVGPLRAEVIKAVEASKGQPTQFSVEPIELTRSLRVTKEAGGRIGWNLVGVAVHGSRRARRS
jgi:hypothetical protein